MSFLQNSDTSGRLKMSTTDIILRDLVQSLDLVSDFKPALRLRVNQAIVTKITKPCMYFFYLNRTQVVALKGRLQRIVKIRQIFFKDQNVNVKLIDQLNFPTSVVYLY